MCVCIYKPTEALLGGGERLEIWGQPWCWWLYLVPPTKNSHVHVDRANMAVHERQKTDPLISLCPWKCWCVFGLNSIAPLHIGAVGLATLWDVSTSCRCRCRCHDEYCSEQFLLAAIVAWRGQLEKATIINFFALCRAWNKSGWYTGQWLRRLQSLDRVPY